MTATAPPTTATPPPRITRQGAPALRLIKAEVLKIITTNAWWIFGIIAIATTALALLINLFQANYELDQAKQLSEQGPPRFDQPPATEPGQPAQEGPTPEQVQQLEQDWRNRSDIARVLLNSTANIYTSGQLLGLVFMVVLGALIMTNEFFHQTATTTFLTTPHRTAVIMSKLAAAAIVGAGFWLVTTVLDLIVGTIYLSATDYALSLDQWPVLRSLLMNLLAYVIWAVLGLSIGVLIRSQLGATLTGAGAYIVTYFAGFILVAIIAEVLIKKEWVWNWAVLIPGIASQVMVSPTPVSLGPTTGPAWWVGAIVLVSYGIVAGVVGTLITRKRDIG